MKRFLKKSFLIGLIVTLSAITVYGASFVYANYPVSVNGQKLDAKPVNINGSTYLPVRAVSEALGVPITWTGKSVEINTVDIDELKEACVMIYADDGKTQVQGSGVYTDYDEVTSALHLTADNRTNLKTSEGTTLAIDETSQPLDVMTLDPGKEVKPVKIGDSDEVKVGDKVLIISSPNGKNDTVIYGNVLEPDQRGLVVKCKLGEGASGGAVFSLNGELIGILIAGDGITEAQDTKYLITPINKIRKEI